MYTLSRYYQSFKFTYIYQYFFNKNSKFLIKNKKITKCDKNSKAGILVFCATCLVKI